MKDSAHKQQRRSTGRARAIVVAVLIILVGAGLMLYPKMTDLRYAWAQWRLEAGAVDGRYADALLPVDTIISDPTVAYEKEDVGVTLPDEAVALLEIPAIDLRAYVLEGTDRSVLAKGPGHFPGTPLPGEAGNVAIAGHRTMHGHPFHDLDLLEPGDAIYTGTNDHISVYRVARTLIVYPNELDVVAQTGVELLTLTTCHPKGSATRRLVVVAELTK